LFGRFQGSASRLDGADDILQVGNTAGKAVDAGACQHIARPKELKDRAQLLPTFRSRPASLFGPDDVASSGPQRRLLNVQRLM
jgi:hypothetical protein